MPINWGYHYPMLIHFRHNEIVQAQPAVDNAMSWDAQKNVELQEIEFVLNSRDVEGIRRMLPYVFTFCAF